MSYVPFHELETLQMQKDAVIHCIQSDELYGLYHFIGEDEMSSDDIEEARKYFREHWITLVKRAHSFEELNKVLQTNLVPHGKDCDELNFVFEDRRDDVIRNALGHRVVCEKSMISYANVMTR